MLHVVELIIILEMSVSLYQIFPLLKVCVTVDHELVAINVIYRYNKAESILVSNERVKNARAAMSLAVFSALGRNLPLFITVKRRRATEKVVKNRQNSIFYIPPSISFPADRSTAPVNRLRQTLSLSALFLSVILAAVSSTVSCAIFQTSY